MNARIAGVSPVQLFTAGLFLAAASLASAQTMFFPLPSTSQSERTGSTRDRGPTLPSGAEIKSAFAKSGPLLQVGPIDVRPHLSYRSFFSDGLLNPDQLESSESTIHEISVGSLFGLGSHWTANYTATQSYYTNEIFSSRLSHGASLAGSVAHGNWSGRLDLSYSTGSPVLVETGRQTAQESLSVAVGTAYELGDRTQLEAGVTRSFRFTNAEISNPLWTDSDWESWELVGRTNYRISERLNFGAGVTATFDEVSDGPDMSAYQPHIQLNWRPSDKVTLSGQGGTEIRDIKGTDSKNLSNFVYSGSIEYQLFYTTSLSLGTSQSVAASFFANQIIKNSSVSLSLSQRLFQRYFLTAGASRSTAEYIATSTTFVSGRRDRYFAYNARISTVILKRGSIGLFYQRGRNSTNTNEFRFSTNQYGAELTYRF